LEDSVDGNSTLNESTSAPAAVIVTNLCVGNFLNRTNARNSSALLGVAILLSAAEECSGGKKLQTAKMTLDGARSNRFKPSQR